ncbi:phosphoribosylpyrophosphate synthetase [Runella sp. CRIBMP]|uniref:Phosphoribosylpyrophosphate synthetase n=1 Tax=Runella salmonicolor TaxID=2950278 RepID=A0ABT1FSI3_9BACT|nr:MULTISPECIES: phosphoribosylpyrophosphate synthetase [Runella]MCP1384704.1 phosphoribosylpyrophosphate synthetase [Runella salmonicolor]NBB20515.1 phosphoribosylpyrophosphate synthetase [Runella sp. CRIBMP]
MQAYDTLSETMEALRQEGYVEDFNLREDCLECREGQFKVFADEFKIDEFFRFEGPTDPADEAVLYAISSENHQIKGLLVSGYGMYTEGVTNDLLAKLQFDK